MTGSDFDATSPPLPEPAPPAPQVETDVWQPLPVHARTLATISALVGTLIPLTIALGVGLIEAFGSFWASAFKEVIVFTAILPVLLWRSFVDPHDEEH